MPALTREAIENYSVDPLLEGLPWMLRSREAWTLNHGANIVEVTEMGWQGLGAHGAHARLVRDEAVAYEAAAVVQAGESTALFVAADLMDLKCGVLEAIAIAEAQDFRVSQDLSVTDTLTMVPAVVRQHRQTVAEGHARYIAQMAQAFSSAEQAAAAAIDAHCQALSEHVQTVAGFVRSPTI